MSGDPVYAGGRFDDLMMRAVDVLYSLPDRERAAPPHAPEAAGAGKVGNEVLAGRHVEGVAYPHIVERRHSGIDREEFRSVVRLRPEILLVPQGGHYRRNPRLRDGGHTGLVEVQLGSRIADHQENQLLQRDLAGIVVTGTLREDDAVVGAPLA